VGEGLGWVVYLSWLGETIDAIEIKGVRVLYRLVV